MASIWVPAVFLFFFKALNASRWLRRLVFSNVAGLFLALCLLGGHHQPFLYTAMALGVTTILLLAPSSKLTARLNPLPVPKHHAIIVLVLVGIFSVCYSSLQLFPSLEYARLADRSLGSIMIHGSAKAPYASVGNENAMNPGGFLAAIFPSLNDVENRPYMGLLPLLFLSISLLQLRRSKTIGWAWMLGGLFLLLSLGRWSPLHGLAYVFLPGFHTGREASRILLICHFAFALLAGFGSQAFLAPIRKKERKEKRRVLQFLFFCWAAITFVVFGGYFYRMQVMFQPAPYDLVFFVCGLLASMVLLAGCRYYLLLPPSGLKIMVCLILLFDFHLSMSHLILPRSGFDRKGNFEPKHLYDPDSIVKFLQSRPGTFRVEFRENSYPRNSGEMYQIETVHGFSATRLTAYDKFLKSGFEVDSKHADMLNVRYFISSENLPLPVVFQQGNVKVFENSDYLPRVWLVSRILMRNSLPDVFRELYQRTPNPTSEAYVFSTKSLPKPWRQLALQRPQSELSTQAAAVNYQRLSPNMFTVSFQTPQPSLLVVSENWYPGWEAQSGGEFREVYQTNGTLMGVLVPAGFSKIVFRYRPTGFHAAIILTGLALILLLVGWVAMVRESKCG